MPPHVVEMLLVQAFTLMPTMGVWSPRTGELRHGHEGPVVFDIIAATERALGRTSRDRLILLTWARTQAAAAIRAQAAKGGKPRETASGSISEWCEAHGVSRRQFERLRRRAAVLVAKKIAEG